MGAADQYDLVIVGGGINGCALARLAARSGLRTALVEKLDFGAGVTSRSTRLIHGGLRYLEGLQFGVVRDSLRCRNTLREEFPGQVRPQPFLLPSYDSDSRPRWYVGAGLALYRALSSGSGLPPPRSVSAAGVRSLAPGLDVDGLLGGFEYHDCQAVYPERLALEMALQAEEAGATIRNHTEAVGLLVRNARVEAVQVEGASGVQELPCRVVVNAAGAWLDKVLGLLPELDGNSRLSLLSGAHIAVRDLPGAPRHAIYREARSDRRPFFIVPWRGLRLIGTTETPFDGDLDRMLPADREIEYLIQETNHLFPEAPLDREAVLYAYSGPRPLLAAQRRSLHRASRDHITLDHARTDGIQGIVSMAGGKLTTAPSFAAKTLRCVAGQLGRPNSRPAAVSPPPVPDGVPARIAEIYGPRCPELQRYIESSPGNQQPLVQGCETTVGEVLFAVERERARTLGDILLRRTGMAFAPGCDSSWVRRAAELAAPAAGWNAGRVEEEISSFGRELARTLPRHSLSL